MCRLMFLALLSRCAAFGSRSSTSVGVLGLGVWLSFCWLRLFLLSTPLCLCGRWLAWLGWRRGWRRW